MCMLIYFLYELFLDQGRIQFNELTSAEMFQVCVQTAANASYTYVIQHYQLENLTTCSFYTYEIITRKRLLSEKKEF